MPRSPCVNGDPSSYLNLPPCDGEDARYKKLYTITEDIFYQINDSNDLSRKLPGFKIDKKYSWGIFQRGYINWKP